MTIKQQGGVFGRNPSFASVTTDQINIADAVIAAGAGSFGDDVDINGDIILVNGKGIDFSATAGTGTSELFDDYEEGTWTPTVAAGAITGTGITYTGTYTKIGRNVTLFFRANSATADIAVASFVIFSGLPFTPTENIGSGTVVTEDVDVLARQGWAGITSTSLFLSECGSGTTTDLFCSLTYYTA